LPQVRPMRRRIMQAAKTITLTAACVPPLISAANTLEFPGTCITPPATVTTITGIDTRHANMEAHYTLPDLTQACS
jgi:hypothetical protein